MLVELGLCDEEGAAVSTEVFTGNTQDTQTFVPQVRKVAERFGCKEVTIIGDRGIIKTLQIERDEEALKEDRFLDGCYVIKTGLKEDEADTYVVHDRYKDLTEVERAFRDCKTANWEVRPIHVRKEESSADSGTVQVKILAGL